MNNNIIQDLTDLSGFNLNFLSTLDDKKLTNLCQLNKKINSYCNDNYFWDLKINKIHPDFPIPLSYRDNKKVLYFILKYLNLENIVKFALDICNVEILNWALNQSDDLVNLIQSLLIKIKFCSCVAKGHKDAEQWAIKNNIQLDYTRIANIAAYYQNFSLLEELASDNIYPNDIALEEAMFYGHLDVIKWLHDYVPNIFDIELIQDLSKAVCQDGRSDILNWFVDLGYSPDVEDANAAAKYGQIQVLDWLDKNNIYPDLNGRNDAIANLQDISLDWMFIKLGYPRKNDNIIVDPIELINDAIIINDHKDLKRLFNMGYKPTQEAVDKAVEELSIESLDFLGDNNIYPTKSAVNQAALNGNYKMLEWFLRRDIYPTI